MEDEKRFKVIVTNFINPHLFWYKNQDYAGDSCKQLQLNEHMQQLKAEKKLPAIKQKPHVGQMLVVEYHNTNMFVRATIVRIDQMSATTEYIMWADDLGFCIKTTIEHIYQLPQNFTFKSTVCSGGILDLMPITQAFDIIKCSSYTTTTNNWSNEACAYVSKLIRSAASITFIPEYTLKNHKWGKLVIVKRGQQIEVGECLETKQYAKVVANFTSICTSLPTLNFNMWEDNKREDNYKDNKMSHGRLNNQRVGHLVNDESFDFTNAWIGATSVAAGAPNFTALGQLCANFLPKPSPPPPPSICFEIESTMSILECESVKQKSASVVSQRKPKVAENLKNVLHLPAGYDLMNLHKEQKAIQKQKQDAPNSMPHRSYEHTVPKLQDTHGPENMYELPRPEHIFNKATRENRANTRDVSNDDISYNKPKQQPDDRAHHTKEVTPGTKLVRKSDPNTHGATTTTSATTSVSYPQIPESNQWTFEYITCKEQLKPFDGCKYLRDYYLKLKNPQKGCVKPKKEKNKATVFELTDAFEELDLCHVNQRAIDSNNYKERNVGRANENGCKIDGYESLTNTVRPDQNPKTQYEKASSDENYIKFCEMMKKNLKNRTSKSKVVEKCEEEKFEKINNLCCNDIQELEEKTQEKGVVPDLIPKQDIHNKIFYNSFKEQFDIDESFNKQEAIENEESACVKYCKAMLKRKSRSSKIVEAEQTETMELNQYAIKGDAAYAAKEIAKSADITGSNQNNYDRCAIAEESFAIDQVNEKTSLNAKVYESLVLYHAVQPVDPVESYTDAKFLIQLQTEIERQRLNMTFRTQSYAWPHIMDSGSMVIIGPRKSGRTLSYILPICNLLCLNFDDNKRNFSLQNIGPIAIILASSSVKAEHIAKMCKVFLRSVNRNLQVTCLFSKNQYQNVRMELLQGCLLLVTTVPNMMRLLNEKERLISTDRLKHLIIDDIDVIESRSAIEIKDLISKLLNYFKTTSTFPQLVVTTRTWQVKLLSLIKQFNKPAFLFGDFLEAAIYGKVKMSFAMYEKKNKMSILIKFIEDNLLGKRLIIFCNNDDEAFTITEHLQEAKYNFISYTSESSVADREVIQDWKRFHKNPKILVLTDETFPELDIKTANIIVHYSLPFSWTRYVRRFGVLVAAHPNLFLTKNEFVPVEDSTRSRALIFFDEKTDCEFLTILNYLQKRNQVSNVAPAIMEAAKELEIEHDRAKYVICKYILEFGACEEPHCEYRHVFIDSDKPTDIPLRGPVRIQILKVFSPVHFAARLLEQKDTNNKKWNVIRQSNHFGIFQTRFQFHYKKICNLIPMLSAEIGKWCVVKYNDKFERARVLEIKHLGEVTQADSLRPIDVKIKLVDKGVTFVTKITELYECEDKFKEYPEQAIDIRLMGMIPTDNEITWNTAASKHIENLLDLGDNHKNDTIEIDINFVAANTIWINNLVVMELLPGYNQYIYRINLKRVLLEKQIAVRDNEKSQAVRKLAEDCGVVTEIDLKVLETEAAKEKEIRENLNQSEIKVASPTTKHECETDNCDSTSTDDKYKDSVLSSSSTRSNFTIYDTENECSFSESGKGKWTSLCLQNPTSVQCAQRVAFDNLYFVIKQKDSEVIFNRLFDAIQTHVSGLNTSQGIDKKSLKKGEDFLIPYEGCYVRAKLTEIFKKGIKCAYEFFMCDIGSFKFISDDGLPIYESPQAILDLMPFQSIHCTLAGIKNLSSVKHFETRGKFLSVVAVRKNINPIIPKALSSINSYEVLLFECDQDYQIDKSRMVNKLLVEKHMFIFDEATKHLLETSFECNDSSKMQYEDFIACFEKSMQYDIEDDEELNDEEKQNSIETVHKFCDSLIFGERKRLSNPSQLAIESTAKDMKPDSNICQKLEPEPQWKTDEEFNNKQVTTKMQVVDTEKADRPLSPCKEMDLQIEEIETEGLIDSSMPLLTPSKYFNISWYQTMHEIVLKIHTGEIKNYRLKVTSERLLLDAGKEKEEKFVDVQFFDLIDATQFSHELRGLNIVIHMRKILQIKWPALTKFQRKLKWLLSYDYENNIIDEDQLNNSSATKNGDITMTSDSDEIAETDIGNLQNYNPIFNLENKEDPFYDYN